jgi:hypothetical protein
VACGRRTGILGRVRVEQYVVPACSSVLLLLLLSTGNRAGLAGVAARKKEAANQEAAVAAKDGRARCGVLVAAHKKSPSLPRSCFVSAWVVLSSLPAIFSTSTSPSRRQNGYRQEGGCAQDASGQGWRWHGQRQGQGRELLQVRLPRPTAYT